MSKDVEMLIRSPRLCACVRARVNPLYLTNALTRRVTTSQIMSNNNKNGKDDKDGKNAQNGEIIGKTR